MTDDAAGGPIEDDAGSNDSDGVEPDEHTAEDAAAANGDSTDPVKEVGESEEFQDEESSEGVTEEEETATTEGDEVTEPSDTGTSNLAERVEQYDGQLATEVRELKHRSKERESRIAELEAKVTELKADLDEAQDRAEDLESRLKRKQADFQNYKKRAKKRQQQIRERATEDFVERLTEVRDNLVRALEQDADADIRPGIESTLETFDRVLSEEGVDPIEPEPGDEINPQRHEVMMQVESDQPEDTIADVYKPGYTMEGNVIEEAQVTVSKGTAGDYHDESGSDPTEAGESESDPAKGGDANHAAQETESSTAGGDAAEGDDRSIGGSEPDGTDRSREDESAADTDTSESTGENEQGATTNEPSDSHDPEDEGSSRWWRS